MNSLEAVSSLIHEGKKNWPEGFVCQWFTSVIDHGWKANKRRHCQQRQKGKVQGPSGSQSEFKANLGILVRACLTIESEKNAVALAQW